MSAVYRNPIQLAEQATHSRDPYRHEPIRHGRIGSTGRDVPLHMDAQYKSKGDTVQFDPGEDYILGGRSQASEIRNAFDSLRLLSMQPGASWKSSDTQLPSGTRVHDTQLILDTQMVFESIVLATHDNQRLIHERQAPAIGSPPVRGSRNAQAQGPVHSARQPEVVRQAQEATRVQAARRAHAARHAQALKNAQAQGHVQAPRQIAAKPVVARHGDKVHINMDNALDYLARALTRPVRLMG